MITAAALASILGLIAFRFLPMIIVTVLALWYWIFDIVGPNCDPANLRCLMCCGGVTLLLGWFLDKEFKNNYGFWVNKLGSWGAALGLVWLFDDQPEACRFLYLVLNIVGMLVALYLKRAAGALGFLVGAFTYIGYEYKTHFFDSVLLPYILFGIGALLIYLGYTLHQNHRDLDILYPRFAENWRPKERNEPVFFGTEGFPRDLAGSIPSLLTQYSSAPRCLTAVEEGD